MLLVFAGWANRRQLEIVDFLQEENRVRPGDRPAERLAHAIDGNLVTPEEAIERSWRAIRRRSARSCSSISSFLREQLGGRRRRRH